MDNPTGTTFADDAAMFQETGSIPPTIFQNLINEYVDNVVRKRRRTDVMEIGDLQDNGPRHMQDEMIKLRDEITEMRGEITEMRNEMSKMKDELRGEQSRRPTQQDFEDAGPPSASQASRIKIGPASEPESIQRSPGWAPSPPSPSTLTSEGADAILAQLEVNIVLMKDDGEVSSEDLPPAVKISAARTLSEAQRRFPSASWKSSIKCATCAGKMPMSSIHREEIKALTSACDWCVLTHAACMVAKADGTICVLPRPSMIRLAAAKEGEDDFYIDTSSVATQWADFASSP